MPHRPFTRGRSVQPFDAAFRSESLDVALDVALSESPASSPLADFAFDAPLSARLFASGRELLAARSELAALDRALSPPVEELMFRDRLGVPEDELVDVGAFRELLRRSRDRLESLVLSLAACDERTGLGCLFRFLLVAATRTVLA